MAATSTENTLDAPVSPGHHGAARIQNDAQALATAHQLAARFQPGAAERDRERRLPWPEIEEFSQTGLWAISVPPAYGGAGASHVTIVKVFQILAAVDPSLAQIPHNHFCVVDAIRLDGSEEQRRFFFGEVLQGKRFGNAFSEAGTKHVQDFQTTVRPAGDGLEVNGRKFYCTGALFSHWVPVGAVDEEKRGFLVMIPRDAPGLHVIDDWSSFGQRTTASGTVTLEGVRVRPEWVIPGHRAYERPTFTGPVSQIIQAAIDAGIAEGAIRETIEFVTKRSRPWIDSGVDRASGDPLTIAAVGDLHVRLHAAEALLERAARLLDAGSETPTAEEVAQVAVAVAEAKVVTTETALLATNKLFELAGTQSTLAKYGLDRHWRNARAHTLHDPARWKYHAVGNYYLNGVLPPCHPWL